MQKISFLCITLSVFTTIWMAYEVGVFTPTTAVAQDATSAPADRSPSNFEEETKLNARAQELADKEKALHEQVAEYERSLSQLKTEKENEISALKARIAQLEKGADEKGASFGKVYEKMDPKRAAKIFDELEVANGLKLLESMKEDKAAEILSKMSPERAKKITEHFLLKRSLAKVNEVRGDNTPK